MLKMQVLQSRGQYTNARQLLCPLVSHRGAWSPELAECLTWISQESVHPVLTDPSCQDLVGLWVHGRDRRPGRPLAADPVAPPQLLPQRAAELGLKQPQTSFALEHFLQLQKHPWQLQPKIPRVWVSVERHPNAVFVMKRVHEGAPITETGVAWLLLDAACLTLYNFKLMRVVKPARVSFAGDQSALRANVNANARLHFAANAAETHAMKPSLSTHVTSDARMALVLRRGLLQQRHLAFGQANKISLVRSSL